ncbi:MAG TPA: 2-amino-4-hydroxy-6-hydroxymethyldihydropteridine diphosphokinase [Phycisphaerae bacterium]|nr:2-amino-4-hydroxy-6-hydroxymethyldihydropteridine diphosphokinase [Phycisphaerae bacterium]
MVTAKKHDAYIGLGSNLGHREKYIAAALNALQTTREVEVVKVSKLYETEPVGGPADQPLYINAAAYIKTSMTPERLLGLCLAIEKSLGRKRGVHWGPRTIDLDLLCYDQEIVVSPELTLPHPMMHERRFVMEPLAEIAPRLMHPVLEQTAREILDSLMSAR